MHGREQRERLCPPEWAEYGEPRVPTGKTGFALASNGGLQQLINQASMSP